VKNNTESAVKANQLAKSSNEVATRAGTMVKGVVSTMTEIQSSSKKIADIIGVIDGIAFQTNILALNAAVEAARAGEQGRGFAVVATEVRNLAQRSATAAKEIKNLISESEGKVENGVKLVEQAGTTMDEVVSSFQGVASLVTEIANASREQSSGIEQVTQAVGQMDEVTQQNAALVEEAAAAAESLEEQARALVEAVSMFKLAEGDGRGGRSATGMRAAPARVVARPAVRKAPAGRPALAAPSTFDLVRQSWAQVVPISDAAAGIFYDTLFSMDPSLKRLFKGDMAAQGKKLMQMIGAAVGKLNDMPALVPILQNLGKRHAGYGVRPEHYATVGAALLATLAKGLGDAFTPPVKEAWTQVYGVMSEVMIKAASEA